MPSSEHIQRNKVCDVHQSRVASCRAEHDDELSGELFQLEQDLSLIATRIPGELRHFFPITGTSPLAACVRKRERAKKGPKESQSQSEEEGITKKSENGAYNKRGGWKHPLSYGTNRTSRSTRLLPLQWLRWFQYKFRPYVSIHLAWQYCVRA